MTSTPEPPDHADDGAPEPSGRGPGWARVPRGQRVLVVPDLHQDIDWLHRILDRETADHVVFLGDYWDAPPGSVGAARSASDGPARGRAGVAATARAILNVAERIPTTFLLGNHDLQYLETRPAALRFGRITSPYHRVSGFTKSKARKIAKATPDEFWTDACLAAFVGEWVLTHAGVHTSLWPEPGSDGPRAALAREVEQAWATIGSGDDHPYLAAGVARGGVAAVGGLTWCDFEEEWEDAAETSPDRVTPPQLFGHTASGAGARVRDSAHCIDGGQTCYAVLDQGRLTVSEVDPDAP